MAGLKEIVVSTRPWSFPMTVISITYGAILSLYLTGIFNPLLYIMTLIGSVFLHAAANIVNDYFDTRYGVDRAGAPTTRYRPHPIVSGSLDASDLIKMTVIFVAASFLIAVYLSMISGPLALALGIIGVVLALSYTSPPAAYKYKALGEVFVLLSWGPIMVLGAYYVQTSQIHIVPLVTSLSLGLLVASVLLANNIRDIEYDSSVNIKTIAIILGKEGALKIFSFMILVAYVITLISVALGFLELPALLVFLTLPKAIKLIRSFMVTVPETADPQTAQLVMQYGLLLIIGIVLSTLI